MRLLTLIILLQFSIYGQNQLEVSKKLNTIGVDNKKISICDYLIINQERDTTHVDTTLNIKKYYKFNIQRKDNFNNISFNNSGQVKNELSYYNIDYRPGLDFGFTSKKSQRFHEGDVKYYHLPTPLSEVFFKTTLSQGQSTDALISA
ncbi:MAG: putative porin, partial [Bacteroidota bacterium]|nr:putative porin [Bacteroidota bacterium]